MTKSGIVCRIVVDDETITRRSRSLIGLVDLRIAVIKGQSHRDASLACTMMILKDKAGRLDEHGLWIQVYNSDHCSVDRVTKVQYPLLSLREF